MTVDRTAYQVHENAPDTNKKERSAYNFTRNESVEEPPNLLKDSLKKHGHGRKKKPVYVDKDMDMKSPNKKSNAKSSSLIVPTIVESVQDEKSTNVKRLENSNIQPKGEEAEAKQSDNAKHMKSSDMTTDLMDIYRFCIMEEQLYLYCESKGAWQIIMESEAHRTLRKIIPDNLQGYVNKQVLYEWLLVFAENASTAVEARYYINFEDCALNWRTREIVKERRKFYFKYALPFKFREALSIKNGSFVNFVDDVFGEDEDTKREFCKFLGLSLSSIRDLKYAFFLYGRSNSGKSVMLNLLQRLMGSECCASLSFSQIGNEFAITQLLGKRLNLSGEVSGVSNKRLDIFKSLTGNDWVTGCFKGKDHFQFINESTLIFACNSFPAIGSLEEFDSFLSRIIIFPFFRVKPRSQWIDNLSKLLLGDIGTIIEMAVAGLQDLEDDKFCFRETESMLKSKQEFVGKYNSFALFADKYIIEDIEGTVTSNDIREQYKAFCHSESYVALADNVWSQYLKQRFVCIPCTLTVEGIMGSERARGYRGIRLNCDLETKAIGWREEFDCYLQ